MFRSHPTPTPPLARLLFCCLLPLLASCERGGSRPATLRLGHGLDVNHPVHHAMEFLAEDLARRSDGELRIEIFPAEQLGSERELLELLQIGSVDLTKVSAAVLESFAPEFRVFGVPYLFDDQDHLWRALEGELGDLLLESPTGVLLRGLCFYDSGARSFYTTDRAIRHPDDLDGLKIRTQESPSAVRMVRALGGNATPISWGELYTALQQGVVDGAENNPPSFHLSRHYEVARFYALDEHTAVPDVVLVSEHLWQRLDEEARQQLRAAARASTARQRELWREATQEALDAVRADGVEVIQVDKQPFAQRVAELQADLAADPETAPLLRAIEAAR